MLLLTTKDGYEIKVEHSYHGSVSRYLELKSPEGTENRVHLRLELSESDVDSLVYMLQR